MALFKSKYVIPRGTRKIGVPKNHGDIYNWVRGLPKDCTLIGDIESIPKSVNQKDFKVVVFKTERCRKKHPNLATVVHISV